jgi:carbonic anhydrase/acetyltransferase-like protein (isoleucine patch superfamily)
MNVEPTACFDGRARMRRVGEAWVAENAVVTARVTLGKDANVWYGVVIRGDDAPIVIGPRTNVQDNAVVHVDPDAPNTIGADITIGHGAIVHGVEVHDRALIGMGAVLLGGCVIHEGAVVGAGAVVPEGMQVPPYALVVGVPARVVREVDRAERDRVALEHALGYVEQARRHAEGGWWGQVRA